MVSERGLAVLRAIVHDYVATREPVGSKSIVDKHAFGVSAATIRNDMALLEDEELIAAPHTSSGRVPTDKGYRVFVDQLADVRPLSGAQRHAIELFLGASVDLDDVLARTTAGGVTINDTLLHIAQESLPFGGVGASGMGQYHGYEGFLTFSKIKPVFRQSRFNGVALFNPPYGARTAKMIAISANGPVGFASNWIRLRARISCSLGTALASTPAIALFATPTLPWRDQGSEG